MMIQYSASEVPDRSHLVPARCCPTWSAAARCWALRSTPASPSSSAILSLSASVAWSRTSRSSVASAIFLRISTSARRVSSSALRSAACPLTYSRWATTMALIASLFSLARCSRVAIWSSRSLTSPCCTRAASAVGEPEMYMPRTSSPTILRSSLSCAAERRLAARGLGLLGARGQALEVGGGQLVLGLVQGGVGLVEDGPPLFEVRLGVGQRRLDLRQARGDIGTGGARGSGSQGRQQRDGDGADDDDDTGQPQQRGMPTGGCHLLVMIPWGLGSRTGPRWGAADGGNDIACAYPGSKPVEVRGVDKTGTEGEDRPAARPWTVASFAGGRRLHPPRAGLAEPGLPGLLRAATDHPRSRRPAGQRRPRLPRHALAAAGRPSPTRGGERLRRGLAPAVAGGRLPLLQVAPR